MFDRIENIVEHYLKEQTWRKKLSALLVVLSLVVVTGVFWSLKMNGIALAGDAFCGKEEHTHTEECYEQILICENNEEGHEHDESCYEKKLICDLEEHIHTTLCYSDINADLESASVWETTLPSLSGNWVDDVVRVAQSQMGYEESIHNFVLDEDQETKKGITRYGQWYGNPYGNWNGMFISFCLTYANVDQDAFAFDIGTLARKTNLEQKGLFESKEYLPKAGDLVFFEDQTVGIISQANEGNLEVIVGDLENKVQTLSISTQENSIVGYGNLNRAYQNNKIDQTLMATIYVDHTYSQVLEDETIITVQGMLGKDVEVRAYPSEITVEGYQTLLSYDIELFHADGSRYELSDEVVVKIASNSINENDQLYIYDGADFKEVDVTEHTLSFSTSHFSNYAVVKPVVTVFAEGSPVNKPEDLKTLIEGNSSEIYLNNDIYIDKDYAAPLTINKNVILDLNGHVLTTEKSLFTVGANGNLTIIDSQQANETTSTVNLTLGNVATYDNDKLTYYVTETTITDTSLGTSQETLVKHEVPFKGRIKANGGPVITINNGTVNLDSGMIYGGTERAFNVTGGTLNLNGGYVFGFTKEGASDSDSDANFGGAIRVNGANLNIFGTVIAGNKALNGGAIYTKGTTNITISGGIISGNTSIRSVSDWPFHSEGYAYRCGGGGIFMNGTSKLTMTNGYITNNIVNHDGYFDGGAGILYAGNSEVTISNGYLTGNLSNSGGGAIRSDWSKPTKFTMTGGHVSGNLAKGAEGGGISINQGGTGSIKGGYINNNETASKTHWGGGGVFCSDGSHLYIEKVLVTDNDAGGFGGGVAGCSTGRVYLSIRDGGAIWENRAQGENVSGAGSTKPEDHTYAKDSPVFMENGYQDYFGALNSAVSGQMLGGGAFNWTGSKDGFPVRNVAKGDYLEAAYVMGLTAQPSTDDVNAAKTQARLYVTGNDSYTHGGGILCNGYLVIGDINPIAVGDRIKLFGTKSLEGGSLNDYSFRFLVTNEAGSVVSVGTSDEEGKINFDRMLSFSKDLCETKISANGGRADFVFIVKEDPMQEHLDVEIDPAQYRITITIQRTDSEIPILDANGNKITKINYNIVNVKVEKSVNNGSTWNNVAFDWKNENEQHADELTITKGATTFKNRKKPTTSLTVNKRWVGTDNLPDSIFVDLLRKVKGADDSTYEIVAKDVEIKGPNWTYTWNNLAVGYDYKVVEHPVPGFITDIITGSGGNEIQPYWRLANEIVAGKKYLIVASDGTILQGNPSQGGDYIFNENNDSFGKITFEENGTISNSNIIDRMVWEAVTLNKGICLKNYPSDNKHYISYQNTDTVKAGSSNIDYASVATVDSEGYLRLYKHNSTSNIKYVQMNSTSIKATDSKTNAVKVYELVGDISDNDDNIITITNTFVSKLYDLEITKVSQLNNEIVLQGAEFNLLKGENILTFIQNGEGTYVYSPDGKITNLVTNADGKIHITGLEEGTYILRETKAPPGYELAGDQEVIINDSELEQKEQIEITVEDKEILYELPETGGKGTYLFMFIGLVLMVLPLIYINSFKRKI